MSSLAPLYPANLMDNARFAIKCLTMIDSDTIAAISTPAGTGAIAVIRMSGPDAIAIASKMFRSNIDGGEKGDTPFERSNLARHGFVCDPDTVAFIDEVG